MNDVVLIGLGILGIAIAFGGSGVIAKIVAGRSANKNKDKE